MKHYPRKLFYLLAGTAIATLAVITLRPAPIRVETEAVTRKDLIVTVNEEGKTRIRSRYVVSAPVEGRIERIRLDEGDWVEQEQVVARLDPLPQTSRVEAAQARLRELQAQKTGVETQRPKPEALAQAQARIESAQAALQEAQATVGRASAALAQARRDRQRFERLAAQGAIPQQELETARLLETTRARELEVAQRHVERQQAQLAAAQSALALLQAEQRDPDYLLDVYDAQIASVQAELERLADEAKRTEILAPVSGYVLRVLEESERYVTEGTPLLELGNPEDLELVIDVLSTDAVKIEPADRIIIDYWGGEKPLEGRVRTVEPSAFTKISALGVEEQRVNVIADLINPPASLGDGYRVEAQIVVWEGKDVLVVPLSALFRCDRAWCVFAIADNQAIKTKIELGRRSNFEAVVEQGIEEGQVVILHPSEQIQAGVEVQTD